MTRFLFMRHGQTEHNISWTLSAAPPGSPLTAEGRKQVVARLPQLRSFDPVAVVTSPLLRAHQTAAIVAEHLALPVEIDDDLREIGIGVLEGRRDEEALRLFQGAPPRWLESDDRAHRPAAGCENADEAVARMRGVIERCAGRHPGRTTVLVSHATLLQVTMNLLCANVVPDSDPERWVRNAGVLVTTLVDGTLYCDDWNDQIAVPPRSEREGSH